MAAPAHDSVPGPRAPGQPRHPSPADGRTPAGRSATGAVITDARSASSRELSGRLRRYTITMAFRMACFLSMLFVEGWPRWVLFGCAVFLPYIAVVLANQSDQRTRTSTVEPGAPADARRLTPAPQVEVIPGMVEPVAKDQSVHQRQEGRVV